MDQEQRARLLADSPLFRGLADGEMQRLAAAAALRRYRRGQIVFAEGDSSESLFIVNEGLLKAFSTSSDGEEFVLAVIGTGETVGELGLADGGLRSASVTAMTDATVLQIRRRAVLDVAQTSPQVLIAMLQSLASVVRRLTGAAADLVFLDLPRRVAKLLLGDQHAAEGGVLTQEEMAHQVGASRQSVNAALRDFHRRRWIEMDGRRIHVRDVAALRRFVGE